MTKKVNTKLYLALLLVGTIIYSCSNSDKVVSSSFLQKRKYNTGWHSSFSHKKANPKQLEIEPLKEYSSEDIEIAIENNIPTQDLVATNGNNVLAIIQPKSPLLNTTIQKEEDCDIIILKSGQEIKAKVLEVGNTEIKYKNCDNPNGPTFTKNKSEIFMIKYPNGTNTVMEDTKADYGPNNTNASSQSQSPNDRSLAVAIVLWLFLGLLGIHRFYLGHNGMGILYLLTAGLCGIGWIIDGILFLTGGLKPKDGEYY